MLPPGAATALAAFLFALLGLTYLLLWWRDQERGMAAMGTAALMVSAFYLTDALGLHRPVGLIYQAPPWVGLLLQATVVLWCWGLARYLGLTPGPRQPLVLVLLAPNVLLGMLVLSGAAVPRVWGNVVLTLVFVGMAALAWQARGREPGAGHGLVAASLILMPVFSVSIALSHVEPISLRYLVVPPLLVFFLTLLTVSLQRRRRALEAEVERRHRAEAALAALNNSLEQQVQQRTADLHDMVQGLESFNRSVSHDLRGPLGGIEGVAQLARQALDRHDAATAHQLLGAIEGQARTSRELVASLLELARVGDATLQRQPVALQDLAREVIEQLRREASPAALPAIVLDALPEVQADAGLLRPVLANLIGNACKFSAGRPAAQVDIGALRQDGGLTVFVRDNGPGFDSSAAGSLFQPFRRLHGSRFAGHGVGLSIVRRAVERHGGRVWAEARPEQGACFYFTLPDVQSAA